MDTWEKQIDWGEILVAQQGALDEIARLREENARLKGELDRAAIARGIYESDIARLTRERDEARAAPRPAGGGE